MKRVFSFILTGVLLLTGLSISGCALLNRHNLANEDNLNSAELKEISVTPSPVQDTKETDDIKINPPISDEVSDSSRFFFEKPEVKPKSVEIKIFKKQRELELYGNGVAIGRFKIGLGDNPEGDKNKEGDSRTPTGEYYICSRNDKSNFCLFLGLSYPNIEDAQRGLDNGLIDKSTFNKIKKAQELKRLPPWDTPLGGAVGIHGGGNSTDWTLGCIAVKNEDVKILWEYAKLKTPVTIYE